MNTIGDRISLIIQKNNLKKVRFAEVLGITGAYVTHLVQGKNFPSDSLIKLICEKFNINENWLRTGDGEMEVEKALPPTDALDAVLDQYELPRVLRWLFIRYSEMPSQAKEEVNKMLVKWAKDVTEHENVETSESLTDVIGGAGLESALPPDEPKINGFTRQEAIDRINQEFDAEEKRNLYQVPSTFGLSSEDIA